MKEMITVLKEAFIEKPTEVILSTVSISGIFALYYVATAIFN